MTNPNLIKEIIPGDKPNTFVVDGIPKEGEDAVWLLIKNRSHAPFQSPLSKYYAYYAQLNGEESAFEAILPEHLSKTFLDKPPVREAKIIHGQFCHIVSCLDFSEQPFEIVNKLPSFEELEKERVNNAVKVEEVAKRLDE